MNSFDIVVVGVFLSLAIQGVWMASLKSGERDRLWMENQPKGVVC